MTNPSGEQFELRAGDQRLVVVEVGGGIRAWDGVLLGYGADEMCAAGRGQVLAPWPNRIAEGRYEWDGRELQLPLTEAASGSAIHGLIRWATWRAVEVEPARVVMAHTLHPQPGYPFTLRLRVEYRLSERGLRVHSSVENVGPEAAPFGMGHHPYILGPADELSLDGEPIGDRKLDEAWHRPGGWRIDTGRAIVWADEAWPWVQAFTGDHPHVGRAGLALEPMSCPPQAFRTGEGVVRLEPGGGWAGTWGIDLL